MHSFEGGDFIHSQIFVLADEYWEGTVFFILSQFFWEILLAFEGELLGEKGLGWVLEGSGQVDNAP